MAASLTVQDPVDLIFQDKEAESHFGEDVSEQEDNVEKISDYSPSDEDNFEVFPLQVAGSFSGKCHLK